MRPVHLAAMDSEDDGKGNPYLFACVHARGQFHARDGESFRAKLLALASDCESRGETLQVWATNLEYDLINVFPGELIAQCSLRFGRSFLVSATWRGIEFRDTVRHVPASVKELGKHFGIPKLTRDSSIAYCLRDTSITYSAARGFCDVYADLGVRPRATLASTALALWREVYGGQFERAPDEVREAGSLAYYGGRTEAFASGTFRDCRSIDAASMFPWAMTSGPFPVCWNLYRRERAGCEPHPLGVYRARVESFLPFPLLPLRTSDGLIYPNGRFEGWYIGEELRYAQSLGVKLRIVEGLRFASTVRPFGRYVRDLFKRKQVARGPVRLLVKTLLTGLYGKFGQRGERVVAQPIERFEARRSRPLEVRLWNGLAIYRTETAPPDWANMVWSALITARARCHLHREGSRLRALGGRLLYCDTDSLIFSGAESESYPAHVTFPGRFELRGDFSEVVLVGKKEYATRDRATGEWALYAKGVPLESVWGGEKSFPRADYLRLGKATYARPVRLLEASRRNLTPNVWREVEKERHTVLVKGGRRADGSLNPHTVGV